MALDLSEGHTEFVIGVSCPGANFGFCQCEDGVRDVTNSSVTIEQFFDCTSILSNAIVNQFDQQSMSMCLVGN